MHRLALVLTLPALLSVALPLRAAEPDLPRSVPVARTLTIRVYPMVALDTPSADTLVLASSLLRAAGIESQWLECGDSVTLAACTRPLAATELMMRLVHSGAELPAGVPSPMGTSLLDTTRRTGVLATLYLDRIAALATTTGTASSTILARAIVHEAAHLVLGSNAHGSTGLMRALWSRQMLRTEPASDWVFSADEATRLRQALAARDR